MKRPTVADIARHLDATLRVEEIPDFAGALNGIQVETEAPISRVAAAVDARERTIRAAVDADANLLLVHHGLFWSGTQPLRGAFLRRVRLLLEHQVAVYSAHLPLDMHPELGNNALLARELGLEPSAGFARYKTIDIGVSGTCDIPTAELVTRTARFARAHGHEVRTAGPVDGKVSQRWAICTGAGAGQETLREAAGARIDTLIVGEGPHWTAIDAEEAGLTIIYAGHYATETLGVRALAAHVGDTFDLPWLFLDAPTGL
ncbi:MAG TPA: Nif3-like dinuclear metal center hexameric protein [Gemmatimonadaceae bacterium]|nr:Nif3-like dinuclear metal center hexameric protein [Gemmatimonadaceae bacterium]